MGFAAKPTALRRTSERPCQPTATERQFDPRSGATGGHSASEERGNLGGDRTGPHPTAHGDRWQRRGGAGIRLGEHGRPAAGATRATRDSRHGTGNGGNRFAGASRVFFFLEEGCGGLLPVLLAAGSCSECWRVERERFEAAAGLERHSQATGAATRTWPRRTARPGADPLGGNSSS